MNLSPEFQSALKNLMVLHEGYEKYPYQDTEGNITIGIGYNLTSRGLPESWINQQYDDDIQYFYKRLNEDYDWFKDLSDIRKMALINMCFMGYRKFQGFKRMIGCLARSDFKSAAYEILDSKWSTQVKGRAHTISQMIESNVFPQVGEILWD
jgi:lysozyme